MPEVNNVQKFVTPAQFASYVKPLRSGVDALALIVRDVITPSATSWADVQAIVRAGLADKVFPVGTKMYCHRGNDTLEWDVIGIDHDTPADPQFTHSLTLQLHDCLPVPLQFGGREAFYYCSAALPAGTYNISIGWHVWLPTEVGKTYQFTTTQEVPAGGKLVFKHDYTRTLEGGSIDTFASPTPITPIETVTMTEGNNGLGLGTIDSNIKTNLNSLQRALLGSNRYKESAIRQWLNNDAAAGSVWSAQNNFDSPPLWSTTADGFLNGMDADFLAVIGKTRIITARDICDGGGYDETDDYFFLLSRSEIYGGVEVSGVNEGEPYPYYSDYSGLSAPGMGQDGNRIKSVQWWRTRTPHYGSQYSVRTVKEYGEIDTSNVAADRYIAPACNVI